MDMGKLFSMSTAFVCLLGVFFLGSGQLYGQDKKPQAEFDHVIHDFGKIEETGGPVSHTFEFTNTSRRPFIIDLISVSCGCTAAEYDKAPVLPGQKGGITITYDPTGRPGMIDKSVIVLSNNRKDRTVLSITGEVNPRPRSIEDDFPFDLGDGLRAESNLFLFGYQGRGVSAVQAVNIYNAGDKPARISLSTESNSGSGFFSAVANPSVLQQGERGQLVFGYDLSTADIWGMVFTKVFIRVNGKEIDETVTAYVNVTENFEAWTKTELLNAPRAHMDTQYFQLGEIGKDGETSRVFEIGNVGESDLIIRDIKANSERITYEIDKTVIPKGATATLKATMRPGGNTGRISESITLVLNDPDRPIRELRLSALAN